MLDQAFEALKAYDWGSDRKALNPIDEAMVATHGDTAARKELEGRLAEALQSDLSRAAKDFLCRKLTVVGTAASVPTLAKLLSDTNLSHMARYALERIPAPEAAKAMRDALPQLASAQKIGTIGSLGVRQDADSVSVLAPILADSDTAVATAAAHALGDISSPAAAEALSQAAPQAAETKLAATDALLTCAEAMLADGKKSDAAVIYRKLASVPDQPKHVRLAATRGMLACTGAAQ